ncbi:hypothetical protein [Flagellimonas meridianipacifica]|uniref:Uncharacterized protein n=1 Tax=Flagellimonas meridianipacifica TaxID=1080225 RepID=A0A2T0MA60_9FLAO|nr:hypothetical protein [Allomuricauda pacifica]PRX54359.1 hypothetical protein CLV81_2759 [Allomuricauda pacifica]
MGKKDEHNFKTPEGYFDNFHERLMQKIDADEDTQKLTFLPESDGFSLPKGYFEHVADNVLSTLDKKETKVVSLKSYKKYYYAAAAIAAVFLIFFGLNTQTESPIAFEDLANAEIDAYLENAELDLTSYELAELVSLEDAQLNDVMDTPLETENILEYLDENIEDIEELNLNFEDYE